MRKITVRGRVSVGRSENGKTKMGFDLIDPVNLVLHPGESFQVQLPFPLGAEHDGAELTLPAVIYYFRDETPPEATAADSERLVDDVRRQLSIRRRRADA